MNELATFTFDDAASRDQACVIVRYRNEAVAVAMSLSSNGDIEVVLRKPELTKLIDALIDAKNKM